MIHVLEHPKFSVRPLCMDGRLKGARKLLDGHLQAAAVLEHGRVVGGAADLQ